MSTNEPSATMKDAPKQPADTSTTQTTNSSKKRKQHWFQRKEQKKKDRLEHQTQQTRSRRGLDQDWESQEPHLGSFAHPEARTLFNVQVPEFNDDDEESKVPKRKVAMLLAYTGTNYGGFQINQGQRSVHAEFELALYKARFLSRLNFGFPHKYSWSNSARTDKGVHACAQVVSAKLAIDEQSMEAARELVNQHLPSDIRVLDIMKTTRSFCAKTQRDRARYVYMIPSFLLYNREQLQEIVKSIILNSSSSASSSDPRHGRRARDPLTPEETSDIAAVLKDYRATPLQLENLQNALNQYEGTRSFHNFTAGKTADDANATRYIISFQTQDPIMMEGMEWIPTQVIGQSFLLHQIRKMVSLAIDVARGAASMATLQHALSPAKMQVNLAPAQGLFLDMSFFEGYNRRKTNEHLENLDWTSDESRPAIQRWKDFRENVVMKHIGKEEATEGNFVKYLYVQEYVYDHKTQYSVDKKK